MKNTTICSAMWIIKKEGESAKGTRLEKSYQEKEGAEKQD